VKLSRTRSKISAIEGAVFPKQIPGVARGRRGGRCSFQTRTSIDGRSRTEMSRMSQPSLGVHDRGRNGNRRRQGSTVRSSCGECGEHAGNSRHRNHIVEITRVCSSGETQLPKASGDGDGAFTSCRCLVEDGGSGRADGRCHTIARSACPACGQTGGQTRSCRTGHPHPHRTDSCQGQLRVRSPGAGHRTLSTTYLLTQGRTNRGPFPGTSSRHLSVGFPFRQTELREPMAIVIPICCSAASSPLLCRFAARPAALDTVGAESAADHHAHVASHIISMTT